MSDVEDENSPNDLSGNGLCVTTAKYSDFWLLLASEVGGLLEESEYVEDFSQKRIEGRHLGTPLISGTGEIKENERSKER